MLRISPGLVFWCVVSVLLSASAYFTWSVVARQTALRSGGAVLQLSSGDTVTAVKVVDGDELSVARGEQVFIVRLLGVKCFSQKLTEAGISEYGAACKAQLKTLTRGPLTVEFPTLKMDRAGRVLAYVRAGEVDVGERLISMGAGVVYTKYAFEREIQYRGAQQQASSRGRGLWASPKARRRALALQATWDAERGQ